ncbi:MAG TPA: hypothetical protein PLT28_13600, partial [Saprospiraceae bacterium]|nr:hypothetical protein [Saprospiraceae bacterium]
TSDQNTISIFIYFILPESDNLPGSQPCRKTQLPKKVPRVLYDAKKFNRKYISACHIDSRQKMIHYDFARMIFPIGKSSSEDCIHMD